jgi:hypothetical protein
LPCDTLSQNSYVMWVRLRLLFRTKKIISNIKEHETNSSFIIFPNPSTGIFNVYFEDGFTGSITILDVTGKTLFEKNAINENNTTSIEIPSKGLHIVKITPNGKPTVYKKIMIH